MMQSRIFLLFALLVLLLVLPAEMNAQCSMCNAVVSSGTEQGAASTGTGINRGILFLMAFPYLLGLGFVYVFFRKQIHGYLEKLKK